MELLLELITTPSGYSMIAPRVIDGLDLDCYVDPENIRNKLWRTYFD